MARILSTSRVYEKQRTRRVAMGKIPRKTRARRRETAIRCRRYIIIISRSVRNLEISSVALGRADRNRVFSGSEELPVGFDGNIHVG